MTARALIIAVEDYPLAMDVPSELIGTLEGADRFREWFVKAKCDGKEPGTDFLRYCGKPGHPNVTSGATRDEILDEMDHLVNAGKDQTHELYVFFSGHGLAFQERQRLPRLDVLLGADYLELRRGGRASIPLRDLQDKVQVAIGNATQYYFVDACRNVVGPDDFTPSAVDIVWRPSRAGMGCVLTLYSARAGARASTKSGFAEKLLAGLRGAGKAKDRLPNGKLRVTFDRLADYVKQVMTDQEADSINAAGCKGVLQDLVPTPTSLCRVSVEGASPTDDLTFVVKDPGGAFPDRIFPFRGAAFEVSLAPGDYAFGLVDAGGQLAFGLKDPVGEDPIDLWDDRRLVFERDVQKVRGIQRPTSIAVSAPEGTKYSLYREGAGKILEADGGPTANTKVGAGSYRLELVERGSVVTRKEFSVQSGDHHEVDLRQEDGSPVRNAILQATGNDPRGKTFEVSESLGPFVNARISLLLSLLGASRIIQHHDTFEKLRHLPLQTFEDIGSGQSAVYVLVAGDPEDPAPRVALHTDEHVSWEPMRAVPGLPGLFDFKVAVAAGPLLFSLDTGGRGPITVQTYVLPSRATLLTYSESEGEGDLELHQYLLPLHGAQQGAPLELAHLIEPSRTLRCVRMLWHVQSLFGAKRRIDLQDQELQMWTDFLYGKWLDPMMGVLAAYELFRRGEPETEFTAGALRNLGQYFGALPDVQLLLRLSNKPWTVPSAPPLVRHGLLTWPKADCPLPVPFPESNLMFQGIWTAWRGHTLKTR